MATILSRLNQHERAIAREVATGANNYEVANRLGVSHNVVAATVTKIQVKLGLSNRQELTILMLHLGEVHLASVAAPILKRAAATETDPDTVHFVSWENLYYTPLTHLSVDGRTTLCGADLTNKQETPVTKRLCKTCMKAAPLKGINMERIERRWRRFLAHSLTTP